MIFWCVVGGKTPDVSAKARTYTAIMQEQVLRKDQVSYCYFRSTKIYFCYLAFLLFCMEGNNRSVCEFKCLHLLQKHIEKQMQEKAKSGDLRSNGSSMETAAQKKKRRWDQAIETPDNQPTPKRRIDAPSTPSQATWAETPGRIAADATPGSAQTPGTVRHWAETPVHVSAGSMTPGREPTTPGHGATPSGRRNRWDETPRGTGGKLSFFLLFARASITIINDSPN